MNRNNLIKLKEKVNVNKAVLAAGIGNFIEVYDYSHYMYFSTLFTTIFFAQFNQTTALTFVFAIHAIERCIRPAIGIIMGRYADQYGRNKILRFSVIGMVTASALVCLIPTNKTNHLIVPLLFLIIRLFQGFFISSEFVTCMVYLTEIAPKTKKGWYGSISFFSGIMGTVLSSVIAFMVTNFIPFESIILWGWKIPYLFGIVLLLAAYKLRNELIESPEFVIAPENKCKFTSIFLHNYKNITFCFVLTLLAATVYSIFLVYMPTHLNTFKQLSLPLSIKLTSFNLCFYGLLLLIMGFLSDRVDRAKMVLVFSILIFLSIYPFYVLTNSIEKIYLLESIILAYMILIAGLNGPLPALISELFPTEIRTTSLALGFGLSLSIAGAAAPFICLHLPALTKNINSPGLYVMVFAFISIIFLIIKKLDIYKQKILPTL